MDKFDNEMHAKPLMEQQQKQQQKRNPEWDRILSASQRNDAAEIRRLIKIENVSPDHSNAVGQTAVHIACIWGNGEYCTLKNNWKIHFILISL